MREKSQNSFRLIIPSKSSNESFARQAVTLFASQLDPEVGELADLRTAVSEAVTNCVVHGYRGKEGQIYITASYTHGRSIRVTVRDRGCGIPDVEKAMAPLFTTDSEGERGGMGFTIMKSFTDTLRVSSKPGQGTTVVMTKKFK